ncbi:hypothetical protein AKJ16_DCAP08389 [Drosera capensis]
MDKYHEGNAMNGWATADLIFSNRRVASKVNNLDLGLFLSIRNGSLSLVILMSWSLWIICLDSNGHSNPVAIAGKERSLTAARPHQASPVGSVVDVSAEVATVAQPNPLMNLNAE